MKTEIRVWDPLVRIFHWGLVLAFTTAYVSGEEGSDLHIYSGYIVLGLVVFRVLWGFAGTRYARFRNFVYAPSAVIQYLKGLMAGAPTHYAGHNPAGGWMVILMLICLSVVSISGLKVYAIEEGLGPLAGEASELTVISSSYADSDDLGREKNYDEAEEFWEEIHEASSNFMLFLIFLHVTGVIVSGRLHNEHLVRAMFTGKKGGKVNK